MNNKPHHFYRYFYWSSIRLDSDPLNRLPRASEPAPCKDGSEGCIEWDPASILVDPGWLAELLMVSALPAFVGGAAIVGGLGRLGVNQIISFMISMPVLISAWYYFVGWLVDRWSLKRLNRSGGSKLA